VTGTLSQALAPKSTVRLIAGENNTAAIQLNLEVPREERDRKR